MCGIFGIVSNGEVAQKISHGLYDLQHRGEQAVGLAVSDGAKLYGHKEEGLVTEVFNERNRDALFEKLSGGFGIGHTLYSTIGKAGQAKQPKTFQPLTGEFRGQPFALGHNGNLIDLDNLRKEAEQKGYRFASETSDTEVIVALLSTSKEKDFLEALTKILPRLKGAFSLTILFEGKVFGVRDKHGIRPLCLGRDSSSFILASEECAFHTIKADFIREINPGEIIVLNGNGIEKEIIWADDPHLRFCIFEYIYFARPDSRFSGRRVNSYRDQAGETVAGEKPAKVDIVCGVPISGEIYDSAVSRALNIPLVRAIIRNRYYSKRNFLATRDTNRRSLARMKFRVLREVVHGKRVLITEDSIVRGDTSPEVSAMLREGGAAEVHEMVGCPPLRWPCYFGVDIPTRRELVAASLTEEEVGRKIIRVDSIGYLSLDGAIKASGLPRENLCLGCFIGSEGYPIEINEI